MSLRKLPLFLILSTRAVAKIYFPPLKFMTSFRSRSLQRRDSSSYLKAVQILSSISASSRITNSYLLQSSESKFRQFAHSKSPSCLNYLKIDVSGLDWPLLNPSLTSAFLHVYLPTIIHIDLSYFRNFPLSSFTSSVNLHRLDIHSVTVRRSWNHQIGVL